jgi:hypothetical protein
MRHQPNRDSPLQVELRGHDADSAGQGSKSANEPMEHAPSDFQLNPTEREPFPVLGGVLHESGRVGRMQPNLTSPQPAQETIAVIADDIRCEQEERRNPIGSPRIVRGYRRSNK